MSERIKIDEPQYDQSKFYGRFQHYLRVTDWRLLFKSDKELNDAKNLLQNYRLHKEPSGTSEEQILKAKYLYESAFHPDTGEKQNILGRMSCQVPGGMIVTGAMLSFYKTNTAVIFWQWVNQSFNALVNYTNRNANSPLTVTQIGVAYVSATSAALVSALGLKKFLSKNSSTLLQRFVPYVAVVAANCTNIPLMRQVELTGGVTLFDEYGNKATVSKVAAAKGISQVIFSRNLMAAPGMLILPIIMESIERRRLIRSPYVSAILQTLGVGALLCFMTPTACALFNQKCAISTAALEKLEPQSYEEIRKKYGSNIPSRLFFNKGL